MQAAKEEVLNMFAFMDNDLFALYSSSPVSQDITYITAQHLLIFDDKPF